jgi:hypothetical protein
MYAMIVLGWTAIASMMTSTYQRFKPDYEAYLKRTIDE